MKNGVTIIRVSFFLISIMLSYSTSYGQQEVDRYISQLSGSGIYDQTGGGGTMTITDDKFCNGTAWTNIEQTNAVQHRIVFELDRFSNKILNGTVEYELMLDIDYWDVDINPNICPSDSPNATESINFIISLDALQPQNAQAFQAVYLTDRRAHKIEVEVSSLMETVSAILPPTAPDFLHLYGEMLIDRNYNYDCNEVTTFTMPTSAVAGNADIPLQWTAIAGAEEYDIEYTFYDDESAFIQNMSTTTYGLGEYDQLFKNNATRITTTAPTTAYDISARFPSGYVLYRVRSARYKDGIRETGKWTSSLYSAGTLTAFTHKVTVGWHEANLNWQGQVSFAEEGKNVPSVNYFDGSLRQRQTVTKSNSNPEKQIIVQQNMYDYHGRPAMSVMAAPTDNTAIGFDPNFANITPTIAFTKNRLFPPNGNSFCEVDALPLHPATGASNYYSDDNSLDNTAQHRFIPDAEGYPFSTTEYTPDLTGRVKRQGGVGVDFQIGSGQETKYYYGKPTQYELDRLFGNEVGRDVHYLKNMVIDPNGQISVSYVDAHGRTIATALAGETPSTVDALSNNQTSSAEPFDLLKNIPSGDYTIQSNETFLITNTGSRDFQYSLDPQTFIPNCTPNVICYDCIYDVAIIIQDNCSNNFNGGTPYVATQNNVSFQNLNTACANPASGLSLNFTIPNMPVGEYKTTKVLTISEESMQYYLNDFLSHTACLPDKADILAAIIDTSQVECQLTATDCANSLDSITIVEDYISAHLDVDGGELVANASQGLVDSANAIFALMIDECEAINAEFTECNILYESMLTSLSPGGNFASYSVNDSGIFTGGATGIFSSGSTVITNCFATQGTNLLYVDSVYIATVNNEFDWVWVGDLNMEQFILNWKSEWATVMVSKHPDYDCYLDCIGHGECFEFDEYLLSIETFQEAVNKGLIDPATCEPMVLENDPCFDCETELAYPMEWCTASNSLTSTYYVKWIVNGMTIEATFNQGFSYQVVLDWMNSVDPTGNWQISNEYFPFYDSFYISFVGGNISNNYGFIRFSNLYDFSASTTKCGFGRREYNLNGTCPSSVSIQNALENVNPSDCLPLSITNLISTLVYCNGETPCTAPFGKGCAADNDLAWQTYVNFYLGEKRQTLKDEDICTYAEAVLGSNFQYDSGIYEVTQAELDQEAADAVLEIAAQCQTTCSANADAWMQKIENSCGLSNTSAVYATIRAELLDVCLNSCGADFPFGATSDDNTNAKDILVMYLNGVGGLPNATGLCPDCSPYLLNFPGEKNTPLYMGASNITGLEQVDDCLCANLGSLEACWAGSGNPSFSDYLNEFSEIKISQSALDTLLLYCDPNSTCTRLDTAIILPPYLNCNTCYTCNDVTTLTNNFTCPTSDLNYDDKLRLYLNYELGFSLSLEDYDTFFDRCMNTSNSNCELLCPTSAYGAIPYDYDCMEGVLDLMNTTAELIYDNTIDSLSTVFKNQYLNKCIDTQNEAFTASGGTFNEYQYTLYYYDQAGNLAKTVPPKGVIPLTNVNGVSNYRDNLQANPVFPNHTYETKYRYNSLNQVVRQISPDADETAFWYDLVGRVAASQDGRQRALGRYSYTLYDELGRIIEVGEKEPSVSDAAMGDALTRNQTNFENWVLGGLNISRRFVTRTYYDEAVFTNNGVQTALNQSGMNSRNRVVSITIEKVDDGNLNTYDYATHYTYDVSGNVKTLVQDLTALPTAHRFKRLDYEYDYISGNVNTVYYQKGKPDQYTYRYEYDDNNRIISAHSSLVETDYNNAYLWENDASYQYYLHGALARTELGHNRVQGCDYAYTLQGWIKGMNSSILNTDRDMGKDGNDAMGNINAMVARDALAYTLGYFNGDYEQIGGDDVELGSSNNIGTSLYNGNIRNMVVDIGVLNSPVGYTYEYDQLHRLKQADISSSISMGSFSWNGSPTSQSLSQYEYDANGNITNLKRYAADVTGDLVDDLDYMYSSNKNRLTRVQDVIAANIVSNDYDYHHDFTYDDSGNIKQQSGIPDVSDISWTAYGKPNDVFEYLSTRQTSFEYSPDQNRVRKSINQGNVIKDEFYVRDAQGNVMAIYELDNNGDVVWKEQYLYGSSRLGVHQLDTILPSMGGSPLYMMNNGTSILSEGNKRYELTNHLDNILVTVSDRKIPKDSNNDGTAEYYEALTISAQDYYPFGLKMSDRDSILAGGASSRFGFNGKESDQNDEWGSSFENLDYGFRIYSPTFARFLSVDPLTQQYPELTPYQFASNTPIQAIDLDGLEAKIVINQIGLNSDGQLYKVGTYEVFRDVAEGAQQVNGVGFENYADTDRYGKRGILHVNEFIDGATIVDKNGDEVSVSSAKVEHLSLTFGDQLYNLAEGLSVGEGYAVLGKGYGGNFDPSRPLAENGDYRIIDMAEFLIPGDAGGIVGDAASNGAYATQASRSIYYAGLAISNISDFVDRLDTGGKSGVGLNTENTSLTETATKNNRVFTLPGDTVQCPTCNRVQLQAENGEFHNGEAIEVSNPENYPKQNPEGN